MTPAERLGLIAAAVPAPERPARWADLGAGDGAFTLALVERLGTGSHVLAVDRDGRALARLRRARRRPARGASVDTLTADLTGDLRLDGLDGVLMANALHYVPRRRQARLLARLAAALAPGGRIVLVEYDLERGNPWVPHPLPAGEFPALALEAGLERAAIVADAPSRYWGRAYCAVAFRGAAGGGS